MPKYEKIETDALEAAVAGLPGWTLVDGKLHREFTFGNFSEAFAFITRVAMDAHLLDHHPEWSNVYNRVTVDLVTHFTGGITTCDIDLAARINTYVS